MLVEVEFELRAGSETTVKQRLELRTVGAHARPSSRVHANPISLPAFVRGRVFFPVVLDVGYSQTRLWTISVRIVNKPGASVRALYNLCTHALRPAPVLLQLQVPIRSAHRR
ncbi:hypothetical protein EVAR_37799_1 [Eumeta japonica]|uniref:Uncharacterized protein n=1 Tax=Eumeta variegata TaxID=151549 RepID=A0A4C1W9T5_EUMVA|nr:hypothetical protein EVAR_37799_1 [Eumeta japonica]